MSTNKPHQRVGSVSNAHVGREFEEAAHRFWRRQGVHLKKEFPLNVGVSRKKKRRNFDLGSEGEKIVVECKSHRWTESDGEPVAKLVTWNESMYYFLICPKGYRRIFFVAKDYSRKRGCTLAEFYVKKYAHMIPKGVEIWEYDEKAKRGRCVHPEES